MMKRKNRDVRNAAGGLAQGERTVRKGGWIEFGGDLFWSERLEKFVGWRFFVLGISDAFSPEDAYGYLVEIRRHEIKLLNIWHLARKGCLPPHLEHLRPKLGRLE